MDIGATAIALGLYPSLVGAVVLAAAVAIDQFRAEVVLAGVWGDESGNVPIVHGGMMSARELPALWQ